MMQKEAKYLQWVKINFLLLKEWFSWLYLGAIDIGVRTGPAGPILAARTTFSVIKKIQYNICAIALISAGRLQKSFLLSW